MKDIKTSIETILKGIGQIMLQDSAWTGLFFLLAICYDSILMGFVALLSSVIGSLTAKIFNFDKNNIQSGLYGFNATLIGVGLIFFFQTNIFLWVAILVGSILSTLLKEFSLRRKIPFFTFPFIVVTVIAILGIKYFGLAELNIPQSPVVINELQDFMVVGHGYGEVIFQGSVIAGLIFFLGVFVSNPTAALYGFVGAIIAAAIAHYDQDSATLINDGMFSFNAVLCGIACSGTKPRDGFYVLLSVVIATVFDIFMMHHGWITLTFPFVLSMWVIVPLKKLVARVELKTQTLSNQQL